MNPSQLHVIAVVSNPMRFKTRYRLYQEFAERMQKAGVSLHKVEMSFGDRPCEVGPTVHVQSFDSLWHKENLINLGIAALPQCWEYVAWIDADVTFGNPDWATETLHALQHHMVVQLFSHAVDLGPSSEPLHNHRGFAFMYHANGCNPPQGRGYTPYYGYGKRNIFWHPGFAWAARREAIDHVGGLIDWAVLGSADHHMAMALIGKVERSIPGGVTARYREQLLDWQDRAERHLLRDVGYVPGMLLHHWHGKKADRRYVDRWQILTDHQFDPSKDLKRDWQGLWQLRVESYRQMRLRDGIRAYFGARNEDSVDT